MRIFPEQFSFQFGVYRKSRKLLSCFRYTLACQKIENLFLNVISSLWLSYKID